jgi:hypothetical protein
MKLLTTEAAAAARRLIPPARLPDARDHVAVTLDAASVLLLGLMDAITLNLLVGSMRERLLLEERRATVGRLPASTVMVAEVVAVREKVPRIASVKM